MERPYEAVSRQALAMRSTMFEIGLFKPARGAQPRNKKCCRGRGILRPCCDSFLG